ncbi:MAG: TolC family protein [Candidatus Hydrogenedentes bacterium]|nr:TolC family protein [Candidatus Hydrogenedentota bacterium]
MWRSLGAFVFLAVLLGGLHPAFGAESEAAPADEGEPKLNAKLRFDAVTLDQLYEAVGKLPDRAEVKLALRDCIAMALTSNQDILVTSFEPLKSDGEVMQRRGEFDPTLSTSGSFSHNESQASSQTSTFIGSSSSSGIGSMFGGSSGGLANSDMLSGYPILAQLVGIGSTVWSNTKRFLQNKYGDDTGTLIESDQQRFETTLKGKLLWGTQYELKLELTEEESTFNQFEPEWSGGTTLSLTQPLMRGRGRAANLAMVRRAKNSRLSAEHQVEQQVMSSMSEVIKAYWDLVGAVEQLKVREESLKNAELLLEINQRRLDIGVGAALEVLQAKAGVATRLSDLASARSQIMDAEDRLKQLLDMREEDMIVPVQIVPIDRPSLTEDLELDESISVQRALENRPEIRMAELEIDSAGIERKRASNDMLPQVDLSGSYYRGGRGGKTRDVFRGVEEERDMSYSISLSGSVPIPNRAARGNYHYALMTERQAEQRLTKSKQEAAANVRMALRSVATNRTLIESNRQTVALQTTNVEAERKRRQLGVTTTYDVLKIQEDLATAQSQEVQAVISFQKALVDLQLAEGVILADNGIEFEPPAPEEPIGFARSIIPPALRND